MRRSRSRRRGRANRKDVDGLALPQGGREIGKRRWRREQRTLTPLILVRIPRIALLRRLSPVLVEAKPSLRKLECGAQSCSRASRSSGARASPSSVLDAKNSLSRSSASASISRRGAAAAARRIDCCRLAYHQNPRETWRPETGNIPLSTLAAPPPEAW